MKVSLFSFLLILLCCSGIRAQHTYKERKSFGLSYISINFGINKGHFSGFNNYLDAFNANPMVPGVTINGKYHHAHRFTTYGFNTGIRLGIKGLFGEFYWKFSFVDKQVNATENAAAKPYKYYQPVEISMGFWGATIYQRFRVTKHGYLGLGVSYGTTKFSSHMETEITKRFQRLNKVKAPTWTPFVQYTFGESPVNLRFFYSINNIQFDYSSFNLFSNSAPGRTDLHSDMNVAGVEITIPFYYSGPARARKKRGMDNPVRTFSADTAIVDTTMTVQAAEEFKALAVRISGRTLSKKTSQPLGANVMLINSESGYMYTSTSDPETGAYLLNIDTAGEYRIVCRANGFQDYEEKFNADVYNANQDISKDILMEPITIVETITIENTIFEKGKSNLSNLATINLDRLADFLSTHPSVEVELRGHASEDEGNPQECQKLSEARVNAVKEYLMSKGIDLYRMAESAYGSSKPVEKGHKTMNRCVELIIKTP
ncbi:MAG: OmpA family protein [Cytophagaceae bacterium]